MNKLSICLARSAMALVSGLSGRVCFGASPSSCRDFFDPSRPVDFAGRAKSLRMPLLRIRPEGLIDLFVRGQSKKDLGELLGRLGLTRAEAAELRFWIGQLIDSSLDIRLETADPQEILTMKAAALSIRSARDALLPWDRADLYGLMFKHLLLPIEPMEYDSFAAEHAKNQGPHEALELSRKKLRDRLQNFQNKLLSFSIRELGRLRAEFGNQRQG